MNDLLTNCLWPGLPEPYAVALRECVAFICSRLQPIGIIAAGSIVRGCPDAASDLDVCVIHREPFKQRLQKSFLGVPAEIFINPPASIEEYLKSEQTNGRPSMANMLATGFVVLDRDPVVEQLRGEARLLLDKAPDWSPAALVWARYSAATRYEDARDIIERDPEMAQAILSQAVIDMLRYCFQKANSFLPRDKDLLQAMKELDPETEKLARAFFAISDLKERFDLSALIADRTIAARGFFEWEGEPLPANDNK